MHVISLNTHRQSYYDIMSGNDDGQRFIWCDDFCRDVESEYNDIELYDFFQGIGRLIYETQQLTETLIIWHGRYGKIFKKKSKNEPYFKFTRANLESCNTIQEIRNGPLGKLVDSMKKCGFVFDKDENAIYEILKDRNYFVHRFFQKYDYDADLDDFNRECRRLKGAINSVTKFNKRYIPDISEDIERLETEG